MVGAWWRARVSGGAWEEAKITRRVDYSPPIMASGWEVEEPRLSKQSNPAETAERLRLSTGKVPPEQIRLSKEGPGSVGTQIVEPLWGPEVRIIDFPGSQGALKGFLVTPDLGAIRSGAIKQLIRRAPGLTTRHPTDRADRRLFPPAHAPTEGPKRGGTGRSAPGNREGLTRRAPGLTTWPPIDRAAKWGGPLEPSRSNRAPLSGEKPALAC